jgi:hypothetical protein
MPVRRRLGHIGATDQAARTRPVLDDDVLPEAFGQTRCEQAADDIGVAARSEWGDEAHRAQRKVFHHIGSTRGCRRYPGDSGKAQK